MCVDLLRAWSSANLYVQITSSGQYAALCTFLEVILTMMW